MRIFVQPPARRPSRVQADDALILVGNTWNDYGYRTLYAAYRQLGQSFHEIGNVKVLSRTQKIGEVPLPHGELPGGSLPDDYISLGNSIDYYERLIEMGPEYALEVLAALKDATRDEKLRSSFSDVDAYRVSLNRDRSDAETFYQEARNTVESGGPLPQEDGFEFTFAPGSNGDLIRFEFGSGQAGGFDDPGPSRRMVVLVGANGVGKTRLLAQIARVAYAAPRDRDELREEGAIDGSPAFPSIVAVSYSSFDDFDPPRLTGDDPAQVARQLREGTGRYTYCGIRDIAAKFENPDEPSRLLSPDQLATLFAERIEAVRALNRWPMLTRALLPVLSEPSFPLGFDRGSVPPRFVLDHFLGDDPRRAFGPLSSGHKIAVHLLASLAATLNRRGLALIDEPETHLHPPLLAALMTGLRNILDTLQSYSIVATHSPVVAQETLSSQVLIIGNGGAARTTRRPDIETFGENTGTLTREIFGLHPDAADYTKVLDQMVATYGSIEAVEAHLGASLSGQALAYVSSAIARRS